jgi:hypothetical protein
MDDAIMTLTATVHDHIQQHGHMTNDEFDRMLLHLKLIQSIPSVASAERGSHTRLRDHHRKGVAKLLRQRGLTLVCGSGRGRHTLKDAMVAGMQRMTDLPSAQEKMAMQALKFTSKVWENRLSEISKLLPEDKAELWRKEVEYQTHRHAHDMQRSLWFIMSGLSVTWPAALAAVMPEEPPPFRMKRPRRRRSAAG